jgi:glucosamine kinase
MSAAMPYVVGIDAGGTKLHFRAGTVTDDRIGELIIPSRNWTSLDIDGKADVLVRVLAESHYPDPEALGVGAHGCDSDAECLQLQTALAARLACPVTVVNDAVLLQYAADEPELESASLVLGTGSIAVGRTAQGTTLYAGGWGWLLGDPGSAWGMVRESIRRLTEEYDAGHDQDPLLDVLLKLTGNTSLRALVEQMHRTAPSEWAGWAPAVFEAGENGSAVAREAVDDGARRIVELVRQLRKRGAEIKSVVAGGGVIAHQPMLQHILADLLGDQLQLDLVVVHADPVRGAVRIASLLSRRDGPQSLDVEALKA